MISISFILFKSENKINMRQVHPYTILYEMSAYMVRPPTVPYRIAYNIDYSKIIPANYSSIPIIENTPIVYTEYDKNEIDQWLFRRRLWVDRMMNGGEDPLQFPFDEQEEEPAGDAIQVPPPHPKLPRS